MGLNAFARFMPQHGLDPADRLSGWDSVITA